MTARNTPPAPMQPTAARTGAVTVLLLVCALLVVVLPREAGARAVATSLTAPPATPGTACDKGS